MDSNVITLVPLSYAFALAAVPSTTWWSNATLSLGAAMPALVLMAAAAALGARWEWIESLSGVLVRLHETRKWSGVWALALASQHFTFKAGMDGWNTAAILILPAYPTRLLQQLSFLALMLIVMLALDRRRVRGDLAALGMPDARLHFELVEFPTFLQVNDLEAQAAHFADGTRYPPRDAVETAAAARWRLLLQLDSDDVLMWSTDSGMLYFLIRDDDRARQDFSRVVSVCEGS